MSLLSIGSEQKVKGNARPAKGGDREAAGFASGGVDASRRRTESSRLCQSILPIGMVSYVAGTGRTDLRRRMVLLDCLHGGAGKGCAGEGAEWRPTNPRCASSPDSSWPDDAGAGLDFAGRAAFRSGGAAGSRSRQAGRMACAPEECKRGAGDTDAGSAVELPGLEDGCARAGGVDGGLPRLFVDAFGALPLRMAANRIVYLGFEDRPDPALALAVERITGLRVESGLVEEPRFRPAYRRMLEADTRRRSSWRRRRKRHWWRR